MRSFSGWCFRMVGSVLHEVTVQGRQRALVYVLTRQRQRDSQDTLNQRQLGQAHAAVQPRAAAPAQAHQVALRRRQ